jgi:hypothetical protein
MNGGFTLLAILFLTGTLVSSCGGGGASGNGGNDITAGVAGTMTVSVTSGATTTTTTYTANFHDQVMSSTMSTQNNRTWVWLCSGTTVPTNGTCGLEVYILVEGTTPGSYPVSGTITPTYLYYKKNSYTSSEEWYMTRTGAVTLTSIGAAGQPITGTFNTVASLASNASVTLRLTGTFNVTRLQ